MTRYLITSALPYSALEEGLDVEAYCDKMHAEPAEVYARFGLSFDPAVPSGGEPGDAERKLAEDWASLLSASDPTGLSALARLAAQFGGGA